MAACSSPVMIQDKTTGGIMNVPCGRCMPCRVRHSRMWSIRLRHELKAHSKAAFVTLTYDDAHLPKNNTLVKSDLSAFMKRLRKVIPEPIRFFGVGEYGDINFRPHYHIILYGVNSADTHSVEACWPFGFVYLGDVTRESINYVAKYTLKKAFGVDAEFYKLKGCIPEFSLMSRRPGIGSAFVKQHRDFIRENGFLVVDGNKVGMPRFYQDRCFHEDEKEKMYYLKQVFASEKLAKVMEKIHTKFGYAGKDYQRSQSVQKAADLSAAYKMKRRKL